MSSLASLTFAGDAAAIEDLNEHEAAQLGDVLAKMEAQMAAAKAQLAARQAQLAGAVSSTVVGKS